VSKRAQSCGRIGVIMQVIVFVFASISTTYGLIKRKWIIHSRPQQGKGPTDERSEEDCV
jgi:hypothetical protein